MTEAAMLPRGHRGYIASRPIDGARVPQHLQNLVVREHARRHGLRFLLSATEYAMPDCYMMLEEVLEELPRLDGIVCYSLFMLPRNPERRRAVLSRVLDSGRELHAAAEDLVLRTPSEAEALDDILKLADLTSTEALAETRRGLCAPINRDIIEDGTRFA